jgi:hypothetical protein
VFTQTGWDQPGYAIRDPHSTTDTGAIETAEEFGPTHLPGSWEPGLEARAKEGCPGRRRRMDWEPGRPAFSRRGADRGLICIPLVSTSGTNDPAGQQVWRKLHQKRFRDKGTMEKLVLSWRSTESSNPQVPEKIRTAADYCERNAQPMRYPKFRRQHLFIGA